MEEIYGYDIGRPDYDLPRNRDYDALSQIESNDTDVRVDSPASNAPPYRDNFYYARPVPVSFPRELTPLPPCVMQNDMDMLYFHYFVNYTSKILVTHECSSNPWRTILPRLALQDENVLSLLLAYAACHRARLLNHPEPTNRIATWVSHVFPTFRQALASGQPISECVFGTCVMLASLTQSYPMAFDLPISWEEHLGMARQMCQLIASREIRPRSKAAFFFLRWFAFLDTFGSCSGNAYQGSYQVWSRDLIAAESDPMVGKCLIGFTNPSLVLLSRVADLSKRCDHERATIGQLSAAVILASQQLRCQLELASLEVQHRRYDCTCASSSSSTDTFRAVNGVLCHAALIMLHRRVYSLPSSSPLIQFSVNGILASLNRNEGHQPIDVPDIILPLFLAGCEATELAQRQEVSQRLQRIGDSGMDQISRVRELLQRIWEGGLDWTTVSHRIFLG